MSTKVLHVLDKITEDSGVSSMIMNYYSKLDYNRLIFDFMVNEDLDNTTRAFIENKNSKIYIMPKLKFTNLFKYIIALKTFYSHHEYKIIHGHVANSAVFYLGLSKNTEYRIIHSHSSKSSDLMWKQVRNWFLTRPLKLVANRYVSCSEEAARYLFGTHLKFSIISNSIAVHDYLFSNEKRREIRSALKINDKMIIGHIGRFSAVKNHIFLVYVFLDVYNKNKNARLMLIGDGVLYTKIKNLVKKLGIENAVLFLGIKKNIGDYLSAMDLFVLPSRFEGLGLAGVEAQTSGLSVLASDKVPRSIDVTGNVSFLKLKKTVWVHEILKSREIHDRLEQADKITGSRFDIENQICNLYYYYENIASG